MTARATSAACAGAWCPGAGPRRRRGRPLINARAETLQSQPAFRESFAERRCLIPADGFYEWLTDERGKRPGVVQPPGRRAVRVRRDLGGAPRARAATSPAQLRDRHHRARTTLIRPIHDRMPVILDPDARGGLARPRATRRRADLAARPGARRRADRARGLRPGQRRARGRAAADRAARGAGRALLAGCGLRRARARRRSRCDRPRRPAGSRRSAAPPRRATPG